jgi:hypothetical protein
VGRAGFDFAQDRRALRLFDGEPVPNHPVFGTQSDGWNAVDD